MGYFSDLSLSRTAEDAEQDRRDGITPPLATWQCAACAETDEVQRRTDAHPELCQSCPVRWAARVDTDRYIVITSSVDGDEYSWRYTRTEAGEQRAAMKLADLAAQGYTLRS